MDKFDDIGKGEPCKTCWFGPVFPSCIKIVGDCGSHNKWHGYKPKLIEQRNEWKARAEKAEAEATALAQEIIDCRTWTVPGPRKENARKVFDHALAILEAGKEE